MGNRLRTTTKAVLLKTNICFFLLILSVGYSFAQQDSLKDYFPLGIGNKWTYSFKSGYTNQMAHFYNIDEGIAEFEIIDRMDSSESNIWHFIKRRTFKNSLYSSYTLYTKYGKDSSYYGVPQKLDKKIG
jgi:hypothetical protein